MKRQITLAAIAWLAATGAHATIDHAQDKNWTTTINQLMKLSAHQNKGKPFVAGPTCYAEDGEAFCATAVWYVTPEGRNAYARVIRDGNTQKEVLIRDICRFNKEMDTRYCVDFDSGSKSTFAKIDGDWQQIGKSEKSTKDAGGGI